jgi:hypothetical protein
LHRASLWTFDTILKKFIIPIILSSLAFSGSIFRSVSHFQWLGFKQHLFRAIESP